MDADEGLAGRGPYERDQQVPLSLRFEPRRQWKALKEEYGVSETGAAVILSLVSEYQATNRWTSYSRSKRHYELPHRYRNRLYSFRQVRDGVDHLDKLGLIEHEKALPGQRGWQSAMIAKPELTDNVGHILRKGPRLTIARPPELVILRDSDGIPADYDDSPQHGRWRRNLDAMNEAITGTDISHNAAAPVVRIFNRSPDFSRGGRTYAQGGAWQAMKKAMRKELSIAGEPVVEIDFKTMHPAILYARAGAPLPPDAYAIGRWPRDLVKVSLLILINASNRREARMAIAHKDPMAPLADLGSQEALGLADQIVIDIKRAHAPIASAFHSDAGAGLMRVDSDIAEAVMSKMLRKGIVVLPVHDSFLVQKSKAHLLEEAMTEAAWDAGFPSLRHERA